MCDCAYRNHPGFACSTDGCHCHDEENGVLVKKYVRKPLHVEAVQVTEENLIAVTDWCGGTAYKITEGNVSFIKVLSYRSKMIPRTKAFVGDWVIASRNGYRVYTNSAFQKSFEEVPNVDGEWPATHEAALKVIGATEKDFMKSLTPEELEKYLSDVSPGEWSPTHEEALRRVKEGK
jgi:hypothetical protein